MRTINLLVVEDHAIVREGLKRILGQHADAAQLGAQAGMYEAQSKRPLYSAEAGLNNAQAAGIPQNIAIARQQANTAQFGEMARAPLYGAQANLENTQAQLAPGSALAQNNLAGAQAGSMNAQTGVTNMHLGPTTLDAQLWLNQNPSKTLTDYFAAHPGQAPAGHLATGTSRVSGKGSGMVDTVQAKLAPKEAVLNAGAAEHLGRPVIQALNAIGVAKMGMAPPADDRVKGANAAQTAGKTGTTNGHVNVWFCGYTTQLAAASWVGDPTGSSNVNLWAMYNVVIGGHRIVVRVRMHVRRSGLGGDVHR